MSKRPQKASGPSQPLKNPRVASDGQDDPDTLQDLAAQQRQQESDFDDNPEGSGSQTLREQVQTLARNQSRTETLLEQLLTKITE